MRRLLLVTIVALVALVAASAGVAADEGVRLTELGEAHFPDRGYALSLPSARTVTQRQVTITENGRPVTGLSVVPATSLGSNEFALALVIDASESMRGEPIAKAMRAARAFAAQREATQRLGAVVFNARSSLLLPFTTDAATINAALANTPPVAYYTRTNDALLTTIDAIKRQQIGSASIVLLSDGRELGSEATLEEAVAAARKANVRVFTVALRSRSFDPSSLQELASQTGGFYTEARSPEQLSKIFTGLGTQLANEYFVHYRSLAGPGERVQVKAAVEGFAEPAISGYETPDLAAVSATPYTQPLGERVALSKGLMVLVAFLVSLLVAVAVVAIVAPRRSTLRTRIGAFVSLAQANQRQLRERQRERKQENRPKVAPPPRDPSRAARTRWERWQEELEIAGIGPSATSIAIWTAVATLFVGWLLFLITGFALAPVFALLVPFGVRGYVRTRLERKRRRFAEQLPDNLEVLASALRAGHSLVGALAVVVADAPEPSQTEFTRVVADEQLGVNLEDALAVVVHRMGNRDLDQISLVARLQRETGASSAEVLERVVENVRERQDVRRLVRTLTAQGRLSGIVLVGLPVFMLLFMLLFNRSYVKPLFTESLGRGMLIVALVMISAGWLAIRRIINIKV
jgi:tight adherence protein B